MFFKGDCSIRVPQSHTGYTWWFKFTTLSFIQILLYYYKDFIWWPIQLQTNFQFTSPQIAYTTYIVYTIYDLSKQFAWYT